MTREIVIVVGASPLRTLLHLVARDLMGLVIAEPPRREHEFPFRPDFGFLDLPIFSPRIMRFSDDQRYTDPKFSTYSLRMQALQHRPKPYQIVGAPPRYLLAPRRN